MENKLEGEPIILQLSIMISLFFEILFLFSLYIYGGIELNIGIMNDFSRINLNS